MSVAYVSILIHPIYIRMADESFQLPKSTYDEVRNIIVAYGHLNSPGRLQDVSDLSGTSTTTISRNNGFLASASIIEGGQKKGPTSLGQRLANALQHDIPDEISRLWAEVVDGSDFLQKVVTAVRIRKGMERSALESHIAYTAGEKKTGRIATGSNTIIDILTIARLIEESDGKLVATSNGTSVNSEPGLFDEPDSRKSRRQHDTQLDHTHSAASRSVTTSTSTGFPVQIKINVTVQCSADELESVGEGLKSILAQLSSEAEDEASGS